MSLRSLLPILAVCLIGLLSSCGEIQEEIIIKKDGSGHYNISADMIPMIRKMATTMASMSGDEDLSEEEQEAKIEEMVWKKFPNEVDSIIDLESNVNADIKGDKKKMALIKKCTAYMRGGKDKGYMKMGLEFPFRSGDELMELTELMQENSKSNPKASALGNGSTEIRITPNSFFRSTKMADSKSEENLGMLEAMFGDITVSTKLSFDRKIKKVQVETYEVVEKSSHTVTVRYRLLDALTSGKETSINIALQ